MLNCSHCKRTPHRTSSASVGEVTVTILTHTFRCGVAVTGFTHTYRGARNILNARAEARRTSVNQIGATPCFFVVGVAIAVRDRHINQKYDVDALCSAWPKRLRDLVDSEGERLKY